MARYYAITYDAATPRRDVDAKHAATRPQAERLDGTYLLKTDRQDLADEEIWRLYMLLTRVEAAFRAMKSPLMERPIFHHLEHRVQTHIFLCVLAYHLLVAIEKRFLDQGRHTSWATLREQLSTHQVVTVVLPATNGRTLRIRKASTPDDVHREIYRTLQIPPEVMKPVKTWTAASTIVTQHPRNCLKFQHSAPQTVEVGLGSGRGWGNRTFRFRWTSGSAMRSFPARKKRNTGRS